MSKLKCPSTYVVICDASSDATYDVVYNAACKATCDYGKPKGLWVSVKSAVDKNVCN